MVRYERLLYGLPRPEIVVLPIFGINIVIDKMFKGRTVYTAPLTRCFNIFMINIYIYIDTHWYAVEIECELMQNSDT